MEYGSQKYRFVAKEDLGKPWFKSLPAGAAWQADGSLKKGDTTLVVCDAKDAARNAASNQKAIEHQHKGVGAPLRDKGATFTIESETAPQIAVPPSRV